MNAELARLLNLDNPSNYDCADAAIESFTSDLESIRDLTDDEYNAIAEAVEDWFNAGD